MRPDDNQRLRGVPQPPLLVTEAARKPARGPHELSPRRPRLDSIVQIAWFRMGPAVGEVLFRQPEVPDSVLHPVSDSRSI